MKTGKLLLLLITAFSTLSSQAQDNGMPDIMKQESTSNKIRRCRKIVYDALISNDTTVNINEMIDYAKNNYESDGNVAFLIDEYRMIYLLKDRYHDFLATIAGSDTAYFRSIADARIMGDMQQLNNATTLLYHNKYKIRDKVNNCKDITREQADFINIYVEWITSHSDIDEYVNSKCEQFMDAYPYSPYTTIIRSRIYEAIEPYQKFGISAGFNYGISLMSAGLTNIDERPQLAMGIDVDFMYKRAVLENSFQVLFGKTYKALTNNNIVVPARKNFFLTNIGVLIGYRFGHKDYYYILPTVGANLPYMEIGYGTSLEKKSKYDDFAFTGKWGKAFSLEAGTSFDVTDKQDRQSGKYSRHEYNIGIKYSWREIKLDMQEGNYNGFSQSLAVKFSYCFSRGRKK